MTTTPKTLLILGATGGTGREVIRQALDRGHRVRAIVRDRARLDLAHPALTVLEGDVLDPDQLTPAIEDVDAVLSALGVRGRPKGPVSLCTDAGEATLTAMARHGVDRLVVVTAGAYVNSTRFSLPFRLIVRPILLRVLKELYADLIRLEEVLARSDTRWTVVRPARLVDGAVHPIRHAVDDAVPGGGIVTRASVAAFMLDCVEHDCHVLDRVSIAK